MSPNENKNSEIFQNSRQKENTKNLGAPQMGKLVFDRVKGKKITFYSFFASNKPKKAFPLVQDFKKFCKQIAHFRVNG